MSELETPTFDHIPKLNELLQGDGVPGFSYYHVNMSNHMTAQQSGLKQVNGLGLYKILGPKGESDTVLMCKGERMPGASPTATKQNVLVDSDVYKVTGLARPADKLKETAEVEAPTPTAAAAPASAD